MGYMSVLAVCCENKAYEEIMKEVKNLSNLKSGWF